MASNEDIFSELQQGRRRFLALVDDVRPDLHRYCARMTGSIIDGEDVVQDTLARAYYELAELKEMPALRPWLFRIAHNRAIDYLRSYERRMSEQLDAASDVAADEVLEPDNALARGRSLTRCCIEVPPACTGYSAAAWSSRTCSTTRSRRSQRLLELSVSAIKSALVRGRAKLRDLSAAANAVPESDAWPRSISPTLARYASLFNLRDWDGVRAMLVDEVKLELISRLRCAGRMQVSSYFTNYDSISDWNLVPGWLEDREILAVFAHPHDAWPGYFVELTVVAGCITAIRDFRYVPYVMREAVIKLVR